MNDLEKRRKYNKTYYAKFTPEEIKAKKRIYNQTYYEKHRFKILKEWSDKKEIEQSNKQSNPLVDSPPQDVK